MTADELMEMLLNKLDEMTDEERALYLNQLWNRITKRHIPKGI